MAKSNTEKQTTNMAIMATDIGYIKSSISEIQRTLKEMDTNYIRKDEAETVHRDHELRLRRLETWGFSAIGGLGLITFALNYFK